MTSPLPPGARRIDPGAEAARLAEARKRATEVASWPVLVDEIRQVPGEDGAEGMIFVHLRVAANRLAPVPADLAGRLAAVLAENWPVKP